MTEYCTIADVRRYARGVGTDKVPDADITEYIKEASSEIDNATVKSWGKTEDYVEYHDGHIFDRLKLENYPVISIASIEYRDDGSWTALDLFNPTTGEGHYTLENPDAGIVRWTSTERPTTGTMNIKVTYTYGYMETPGYIKKLCAIIAAMYTLALAAGDVSPDGLVSISEGALSLSWGGGPYMETIDKLIQEGDKLLKGIGRRMHFVPSAK